MTSLEGRVVVVTGAARGMGKFYTKQFLAEGCKVVASDLSWETTGRSHDDASEFKKFLNGNPNALAMDLDISDQGQLNAAYAMTIEAFGTVDVLVNNGAMRMNMILPSGRIDVLDMDMADFERMMTVNVNGVVRTVRTFVPPMIEQHRGSIVNVSGGNGGIGGDGPYGASKAAVRDLTSTLAAELKKFNISVNSLHPAQPRSAGYEEQVAAREKMGISVRPPARIEAHWPLMRIFAAQDADGGLTGKLLDIRDWNLEHGLGDFAE